MLCPSYNLSYSIQIQVCLLKLSDKCIYTHAVVITAITVLCTDYFYCIHTL